MYKMASVALLSMVSFTPINAATYVFEMTGTINRFASYNGGDRLPNFETSLEVGDAVRASLTFDTDNAELTSLYNADPTTNIYYLRITDFSFSVGDSFSIKAPASVTDFASLQIWDNRQVDSSPYVTDLFSLSTLRYFDAAPFTDDGWDGQTSAHFNFDIFDNTGLSRSSDLITEVPPLDAYRTNRHHTNASIGFINSESRNQVVGILDNGFTASLRAVPEPATWMMMIVGFGIVGVTMRRRSILIA